MTRAIMGRFPSLRLHFFARKRRGVRRMVNSLGRTSGGAKVLCTT